jgi:beta-glucosidase
MAVAFIRGLQGDDPKYAKAMACAKHFAVHSGPESARHTFDARVPERDFYETYLPHFEAAVREGKVWSVMGAYNSVYGEPACSSPLLLGDLLRKQWGFQGHIVSDCGAIYDIFANHKAAANDEAAASWAVKAGCDMCCGDDYSTLPKAVRQGLITEAEMDVALGRLLASRFRLGLFDPPEQVAYARIPFEANDTDAHHALALRAARESMVLLKNNGVLPLSRARLKRLAVIGTNACSVEMMLGNYSGTPSKPVTILDGIKAAAGLGVEVIYDPGCPLAVRKDEPANPPPASFAGATRAAASADVVICVGGLNPQLEGEEMPVNYVGFGGGDRTDIALPAVQDALLKALHATGKPVVFVNCSGSAVAMVWAAEHLPAILQAWYPGGQGGQAVAETLFGDANPAGRLPVTFYRSTGDLPPFEDYRMSHRTYRYFTGKPLFAFGHGLSYTEFTLTGAKLGSAKVGRSDSVRLAVDVKNSGQRAGNEVVQVYFRHVKPSQPQPRLALCAFTRVNVPPGKTVPVSLEIPVERFRFWDTAKKSYAVEPGAYEILIGGASDKLTQKLSLAVR